MENMTELTKRLGQLFIVGFPGAEPPRPFLNVLAEEQIGGVILFEENCPTHGAAHDNIRLIREQFRGNAPFIAVDQEGGRVSRLRGAPAEFQAAAVYGRDNALDRFKEDYRRSVVFMESLGINLNLAPVCDLYTDAGNTCLDERCFGSTPPEVIPFVETAVRVARSGGLLSCLKHFPGLGSAKNDPHDKTSVIEYDELLWEQRERRVFAAGVVQGADIIMTTHVFLKGLDSRIATGSSIVVRDMLRGRLAFDGPVITDDLTMAGADVLGDIGPRTVAAFNAGHDLLLYGRDWEQAMRAYDYFVDACRCGDVKEERVHAALGRVSGVKFKLDSSVLP